MNASKLVFRGNITGPGEWYGKTEKQGGEKTLVLFKRPGLQGDLQGISDKFNGIRKGPELVKKFIQGKQLELLGDVKDQKWFQGFLNEATPNQGTLDQVANSLNAQTKEQDGSVKLNALAEVKKGPEKGQLEDILISWQPNKRA